MAKAQFAVLFGERFTKALVLRQACIVGLGR